MRTSEKGGTGQRHGSILDRIRHFRDQRNWEQFHSPKNLAISVSVEAGELLELFQWRPEGSALTEAEIENVKSEIADVYLYLLLLSDAFGIDIEAAAHTKVTRNEQRFPVEVAKDIAKPRDVTAER
jgi:NTP pyrophosphatase (non-canonical NTP hydrolase)